MKRLLSFFFAAVLAAAVFFGCGKKEEPPEPVSSAESVTEPEIPPEEADDGLRTLLIFDGQVLRGSAREVFQGGFETVSVKVQDAPEEAESASLLFDLGKQTESGYLRAGGTLFFGHDASALFDADAGVDEEDPTEGGGEDAAGAEADGGFLRGVITSILEEGGSSVRTLASNGLSWNAGSVKETGVGGYPVLNYYAWCESGDGLIYFRAGVSLSGDGAEENALDRAEKTVEAWLQTLTLETGAPGGADHGQASLGAEDYLQVPFGGKTISAAGPDLLIRPGTELSWSAGEQWLGTSYRGDGGETEFVILLRNAACAGDEETARIRALTGDPLSGTNLNWTAAETKDAGARFLEAHVETGEDVLVFTAYAFSDASDDELERVISQAKAWLLTVKYS